MKTLEDFLKPTQKELFSQLRKMYRGVAIVRKGSFILVPGEAPIMLLAHMDTVHEKPVKDICKSSDGNILMSPQGIGGDDRCGIYAITSAYKAAPVKPWLLFTCDEEIGGVGARAFASEHDKGKLPKELDDLKLLVEVDRKGSKDAVYYDCDNPEFEAYITSKGFVTAYGSYSDISTVAPELGVAAVNLSSGYHNAHTLHEYINRKQINATTQKVIEIVADAAKPDFPKYEFIEYIWEPRAGGHFSYASWDGWDDWRGGSATAKTVPLSSQKADADASGVPLDLPSQFVEAYNELLELYSHDELEEYRHEFGDNVIWQLYETEFGPFYDTQGAFGEDEEAMM